MYNIIPSSSFSKELKNLAKKYPRIKQDYADLLDSLEQGDFQGDRLQDYPGVVYKVRIGSIDQQKGKRGGFRLVYIVITQDKTVYLMAIYAKAYQEDLTETQKQGIKDFLQRI
jgi:mRNA-degrading endonuclease RelE of RelBE toxin-antitoxin system